MHYYTRTRAHIIRVICWYIHMYNNAVYKCVVATHFIYLFFRSLRSPFLFYSIVKESALLVNGGGTIFLFDFYLVHDPPLLMHMPGIESYLSGGTVCVCVHDTHITHNIHWWWRAVCSYSGKQAGSIAASNRNLSELDLYRRGNMVK